MSPTLIPTNGIELTMTDDGETRQVNSTPVFGDSDPLHPSLGDPLPGDSINPREPQHASVETPLRKVLWPFRPFIPPTPPNPHAPKASHITAYKALKLLLEDGDKIERCSISEHNQGAYASVVGGTFKGKKATKKALDWLAQADGVECEVPLVKVITTYNVFVVAYFGPGKLAWIHVPRNYDETNSLTAIRRRAF